MIVDGDQLLETTDYEKAAARHDAETERCSRFVVMENLQVVPQTSKVEPVLPANRSELRRLLVAGKNRGWKRPLSEIQSDLIRPLPDEFISWFQKRSVWIPYLKWHDTNSILDYVSPGWRCDVSENQVGDRVVVKTSLTLLCAEGRITRSSLGSDDLADEDFSHKTSNPKIENEYKEEVQPVIKQPAIRQVEPAQLRNRSLFSISDDIEKLNELLDESGDDFQQQELIYQWFEKLGDERDRKLDGYAALITEMTARVEIRKAEAKRLMELAQADENRARLLKDRLKWFFETHNLKTVETARYKL